MISKQQFYYRDIEWLIIITTTYDEMEKGKSLHETNVIQEDKDYISNRVFL